MRSWCWAKGGVNKGLWVSVLLGSVAGMKGALCYKMGFGVGKWVWVFFYGVVFFVVWIS